MKMPDVEGYPKPARFPSADFAKTEGRGRLPNLTASRAVIAGHTSITAKTPLPPKPKGPSKWN